MFPKRGDVIQDLLRNKAELQARLSLIPYELVDDFRNLLVSYYEGKDNELIKEFLKERCWRKFN